MFNQQKTGFGTSTFGATSGGLFGNKTNATGGGGLFGSSGGTSAFGATSTSAGFGGFGSSNSGSIFGTPATKATGGGLFGTPTQSTFGPSTQSGFGTSTFSQNRSGGLFGSSTPASTAAGFGGSLFGASGGFGQQTQQQNGTGAIKFAPTSGSDTAVKNGIQQSISTRHQCITAMKEYEGKSFEELRTDDYLAGRKGPSAGTSFGGATSSAGTGFSFGQKSTASGGLFGSTAKPAFGQASGGGLFGSTNTSTSGGLFGANKSFGTATTTASGGFSFGTSSTGGSLFGNNATKPSGGLFGNTATSTGGSLFGNTASSGFGTTNTFGSGGNTLFGAKPATGFGATTQASTGFGNSSGGIFGASGSKPTTGLFGASGFGQQSGSLFGKTGFGSTNTTNTTGSLFGNTMSTSNTQNKSLFSGFGSGGSALGGSTGFNFNTGGSTLGGGAGGFSTGFGGSSFGQQTASTGANAGLALSAASNQQTAEMLQTLLAAPFGDSPLFKNNLTDPEKRQEVLKPTNPIAQKAALQSPLYRVSPGSKAKIKPKARTNQSVDSASCHGKPHQLFAGLEPEEEADVSNRSFVGKSSVKKLMIKVTPNTGTYPVTSPSSTPSFTESGLRRSSDALKTADVQQNAAALSGEELGNLRKSSNSLGGVESGRFSRSSNPLVAVSSSGTKELIASSNGSTTNEPEQTHVSKDSIIEAVIQPSQVEQTQKGNSRSSIGKPSESRYNDTFNDLDVRPSKSGPATEQMSDASSLPKVDALNVSNSSAAAPDSTSSFASTKKTLELLDAEADKNGLYENGQNEEDSEPHPAGITLKRAGYYTIPDVEELANMLDDNNRCKITDFTIGRRGYGSVFFEGEVDITGMDFDHLVHIRRKEVTVYPDDDEKPPLGVGLNRPAEVTLDCVWPIDKATREPVTDPDRLLRMGWEPKLELITAKMGARFVDYRPDTGSWVFQVNHFSKYGLLDSDDDDAEVEVDQAHKLAEKAKKELIVTKKAALWSTRVNSDLASKGNKPQIGLGVELAPSGGVTTPRSGLLADAADGEYAGDSHGTPVEKESMTLFHRIGLKPQKLQCMKASFFADDEGDHEATNISLSPSLASSALPSANGLSMSDTQTLATAHSQKSLSATSLSPSLRRALPVKTKRLKRVPSADVMLPTQELSALKQANRISGDSPAASVRPRADRVKSRRRNMPTKRAPRRLPVLQPTTLQTGASSRPCDAAQFLGRSFRVGWGPGWKLVHSGIANSSATGNPDEASNVFGIFSGNKVKTGHSARGFPVHIEKLKSAPHLPETSDPPAFDDVIGDLSYLTVALRHSDVLRGSEDTQMDTSDAISQMSSSTAVSSQAVPGTQESTLPLFQPVCDLAVLEDCADVAREAWNTVDSAHSDSGYVHLCHLVFELCHALWGTTGVGRTSGGDEASYQQQMMRKKRFCAWLARAVQADVSVGLRASYDGDDSVQKMFSYITEGRLDKAVKCASTSGNVRLGCLLSTSSSCVSTPVAAAKQLVEWLEVEADRHIADTLLKLYSLLAAKPVWLSSKGPINTCSGLDWKRSLLLHLTYISKPVSPVAEAVRLFRNAWKGDTELGTYSAAPVPSYVERSRCVVHRGDEDDCSVRDICYHLVQLYCKRSHRLEMTLCPSSSVPHPLDYRVAWHVWRVLYSAGYRHNLRPRSTAYLHVSYAAQLESHGLWHQAAFVLMHITNNREREMAVKSLLSRHVRSGDDVSQAQERFVVEQLGVPVGWLHECRALHAKSRDDKDALARHLLASGHWKIGHDMFMKGVAADALIHERYECLCDLLAMIATGDHVRAIPGWEEEGKVYHDYLGLTRRVKKLEEDDVCVAEIEAALEELRPQVTSLCQRIAKLNCRSAKDRLARAEMAKQVLNLHNVMHALLQPEEVSSPLGKKHPRTHPGSAPPGVVAPQATKLHLPEDYAIEDLSKIVHDHFIELYSLRKTSD